MIIAARIAVWINMHICAGIITYNPTLTDVSTCLEALCNQVERVIIVDNASKNVKSLQEVVSKYTNVTLVKNSQNIGFAKALTQVFEWAKSQGFNWVLTLNDDSVVPSNMISEYKKILENQGSLVNQKMQKIQNRNCMLFAKKPFRRHDFTQQVSRRRMHNVWKLNKRRSVG